METTEKWSKKDGYNTKYYTKTEAHGRFAMPILKATNYKPDMLIGFNEMLTTKRNDCGIHFFLDDYQFERVWRRPEYYLSKMRDFQCIFTPDFSLYTDMAIPVQIWNVYRSRLIGQIAQKKGLTVIPTVSWSTEDSFQFCFDGLPKDGTVAISTIGIKKGEKHKLFSAGVEAMIDKIRPNRILIYGGKVDCNYQGIETVYYDNNVTERLHKLKKEEKHGGRGSSSRRGGSGGKAGSLSAEAKKMSEEKYKPVGDVYVSCDYGIQNATVFLMWAKIKGIWTCIREYCYSGRANLKQKTDAEFVQDMKMWLDGTIPKRIIVDPSATSFIAELRRNGYTVKRGMNDVLDGIRYTSTALGRGELMFVSDCVNTIREFHSYMWDLKSADAGEDRPLKEHDHCMDAMRYFTYTIMRQEKVKVKGFKEGI